MERKIEVFLNKWQKDIIRKPLLLYGPRQVGKTYSVLTFGKTNYKNVAYINTFNNSKVLDLFTKEKATDKLIKGLSTISGTTILENDTLVILDNIDNINILKGIKLFGSERSKYHLILITSHRDNLSEFKAEELQYKGMSEMDFEEYLWAHDEKALAGLIKESFTKHKTCPFHKVALDLFYKYLMTGGLPEAVEASIEHKDFYEIDLIKQKLFAVYEKDIALNPTLIDIPRGIETFEAIPSQLTKPNKKFQYGLLGKGKRASEYDSTINYLVNNQIVYRSYKITTIKSPLSSCREKDSFKLYLPDDGLLFSMLHLTTKDLTDETLKESLYENHIAKTLVEAGYSLYYYQSQGKAEVNFVIQNRMGEIIPLELATRSNSKVKSLSVFMKNFTTKEAYRITENNFSTKKDIRYIPIYAVFCLNDTKM